LFDHSDEIRRHLTDPVRLCRALGLTQDAHRTADGLTVRCPAHQERTPSCSVTRGQDGTVRVRCFGCGLAGDGFVLVAAVVHLDYRSDFREVMAQTADLIGLRDIADEIREGRQAAERPLPTEPTPAPERVYPPRTQVLAVWDDAGFVNEDCDASRVLVERKLDPDSVAVKDLARVLRHDQVLPPWARYRGDSSESRTWLQTGHRLLLPTYAANGNLVSLRAWRLTPGDSPKRLPPSGHKATGLVLASAAAVRMLRGEGGPGKLVVSEGEPDFLSWSIQYSGPVIGITSGSWTSDFASRIPLGSEVILRTDLDDAGEKYARQILEALKQRCTLHRLVA
jgi:hypothetical protein